MITVVFKWLRNYIYRDTCGRWLNGWRVGLPIEWSGSLATDKMLGGGGVTRRTSIPLSGDIGTSLRAGTLHARSNPTLPTEAAE